MNGLRRVLDLLRALWTRLEPARPWLLRLLVYPAFFTFWFVTFVYVTFPYDRLKETLIASVEAPRTTAGGVVQASNMRLRIGSLGPTLLPGIYARDVTVVFLPERPTDRTVTMQLERVTARVGLFRLLFGTLSGTLGIKGLGGEIDADFSAALSGPRAGLRSLELKLTHVSLEALPPVAKAVGLPIFGNLDGTVSLEVPDGRIDRSTGTVALTVDDLRVGDGRAQFEVPSFGGVTIEQIRAGQLTANLGIRNGVATLDRVGARSNEFVLAMDGRIELREDLSRSALNAGVRFSLTDAFRNKSEVARRIMMVLDMAPPLRAARRPDGMFGFRCRGTFAGDLQCPPDGRGGSASSGPRLP